MVEVDVLELQRQHDGFLRGAVEPVLIVGLFATGTRGARLLARQRCNFEPVGQHEAHRVDGSPLTVAHRIGAEEGILLVAFAMELDAGKDIEDAYALIGTPNRLLLYPHFEHCPNPVSLEELAAEPGECQRMRVLNNGVDMGDCCTKDKWVDACALVVDLGEDNARMHFVSDDQRNEWTATIRYRMSIER